MAFSGGEAFVAQFEHGVVGGCRAAAAFQVPQPLLGRADDAAQTLAFPGETRLCLGRGLVLVLKRGDGLGRLHGKVFLPRLKRCRGAGLQVRDLVLQFPDPVLFPPVLRDGDGKRLARSADGVSAIPDLLVENQKCVLVDGLVDRTVGCAPNEGQKGLKHLTVLIVNIVHVYLWLCGTLFKDKFEQRSKEAISWLRNTRRRPSGGRRCAMS